MKDENDMVNIPVYEILLGIGAFASIFGLLIIMCDAVGPGELFGIDAEVGPFFIVPGFWVICGYITHKLLPAQKGSFAIGLVLGVIGIIIAFCIKPRSSVDKNVSSTAQNNTNKYEDLQKLAELKQQGIITEQEFEQEKAKILN